MPIKIILVFVAYFCWVVDFSEYGNKRGLFGDELSPHEPLRETGSQLEHQDLLRVDAALYDAGFAGTQTVWVVGNHGVVLKSKDAGASFQEVNVRKQVHWRCLSIVNQKVIWIAGYLFDQRSLSPQCCVICSVDGGDTWEEVPGCSGGAIPIYLMVNSAGEGYLVTTAFGETSGGYWKLGEEGWSRTTNLGKQPWRTAAFLTPELGVLAGRDGRYVIIAGGKEHADGVKRIGRIGFNSMCTNSIGHLFACGDEETLIQSVNGGNSWVTMLEELPENKSFSDIKTIAAVGKQFIWKTGTPGTTISRSVDAGKTWTNYVTGVSSTLRKISFVDEKQGVAVGDMGVVLSTHDGGVTWECVRNFAFKTAMLCFTSKTAEIPASLLLKKSRDEGFRLSLHGLMHHDVESHPMYADEDLRLELCGIESGVVATSLDHVFPLDRPDMKEHGKLLFKRWGQLLDQRDQTILNRLVARIRQERPLAILLEAPHEDDRESAVFLLNRIIHQAIQAAKDANYQDQSLLESELLPWEVKQVFEVLPIGEPGKIRISTFDYLPREEKHVGILSDPLQRFSSYPEMKIREDSSFQVKYMSEMEQSKLALINDILPSYSISPGSAQRRNISLQVESNSQVDERTKKIKQTYDIASRFATDPVKGTQLLGELEQTLKLMQEQEGAAYLQRVIEDYLAYGELELGLQMSRELITRFPQSAEARRARVLYFQMIASDEINYFRYKVRPRTHVIKQATVEMPKQENNAEKEKQIQELIKKTIPPNVQPGPMRDLMEKKIRDAYSQQFQTQQGENLTPATQNQEVIKAAGIDQQELEKTYAQALEEALKIKRSDTELFQQPAIQFPLARVLHKNFKEDLAHDLLQKMSREMSADWSSAIRTEIWHYYPAGNPAHELFTLDNLKTKPHLDGLAEDAPWNAAVVLPIGYSSPDELGDRQLSDKTSMKCYHDGSYLYIHIHCMWLKEPPASLEKASSRQHDFNMDGRERISIMIDIDRDYFTSYQLEVSTDGQTRDSCAGLACWNPTWYVANKLDEQAWQTEMAIPLNELAPMMRLTGQTWNLQVMRITPGEPIQALAHPASLPFEMKNSALVKFK